MPVTVAPVPAPQVAATSEAASMTRAPGLSCLRSCAGDTAQVTLAGELDIATVPHLDGALRRAESDAPSVVLDLRELELMDFGAAQLLLAAHRRIRAAGGRLSVIRGPAEVEWFLALIGVDRELDFVDRPAAGGSLARGWEAGAA